jgi:hypothetical protein
LLRPLVECVVKIDVRKYWAHYATNNVAKTMLELVKSIPRKGMRANYGHGFLGAPLTTENSQEKVTGQDRGVRCESTTPEQGVGGESDV